MVCFASNKLFIIKDIASDLTALENTVRLHTLTNSNDDLEAFYSLEEYITQRVEELNNLKGENEFDIALIDSFSKLAQEKLDLWDEILEQSRAITTDKYRYIKNNITNQSHDAHQAYLEFHRPAIHIMRNLKENENVDALATHPSHKSSV